MQMATSHTTSPPKSKAVAGYNTEVQGLSGCLHPAANTDLRCFIGHMGWMDWIYWMGSFGFSKSTGRLSNHALAHIISSYNALDLSAAAHTTAVAWQCGFLKLNMESVQSNHQTLPILTKDIQKKTYVTDIITPNNAVVCSSS